MSTSVMSAVSRIVIPLEFCVNLQLYVKMCTPAGNRGAIPSVLHLYQLTEVEEHPGMTGQCLLPPQALVYLVIEALNL